MHGRLRIKLHGGTGMKARAEKLIVLARWPVAGLTKTRLARAIGAPGAAAVQHRMTLATLATVSRLVGSYAIDIELRMSGAGWDDQLYRGDWSTCDQGSGDLGCRIGRATRDAFEAGFGAVVVIGTD